MTDVTAQIRQDYDSIPYESFPFPQTSPAHLAAVAHLFGLTAPPPATARILELGCASGGNILPHAIRCPEARIIGVDLSPVQVAAGQKIAAMLSLDNIELRQGDIAELGADLGLFDYIICHGVFSWVPGEVQDAILRICRDNLAPDGVAYVSYNCYPGWKTREIIRDAMLLRGKESRAEANPLGYAKGMVDFLKEVAPGDSLLGHVLQDHGDALDRSQDYYLAHEYLETVNRPCYFGEFADRAEKAGLGYLAEAAIASMFVSNYGEKVARPLLDECGDSQVRLEQYLDFVSNRSFRQTLLVHSERLPDIRYRLDAERLRSLHIAASLPPREPAPVEAGEAAAFGPETAPPLFLHTPAVKAAAKIWTENWPATCSFADLSEAALRTLKASEGDTGTVEAELMQLVELVVIQGRARISLEPVGREMGGEDIPRIADMWRRYAAATGAAAAPLLVNAWHEAILLDPVERHIVDMLDGATHRAALVEFVVGRALAGAIIFFRSDDPVGDVDDIRTCATDHVNRVLADFPKRFLMGPDEQQTRSSLLSALDG
ncbi:methyltransferase regulatory domain-containing protein [Sphingopyxis sp. LARHCG72]